MNGRAYDYQLGRFLSVDPFIQFPANSQSLNPYSYILNNPMAGTDPTGYYAEICARASWLSALCSVTMSNDRPAVASVATSTVSNNGADRTESPAVVKVLFPKTDQLGDRGEPGTFLDFLSGASKTIDEAAVSSAQLVTNPLAYIMSGPLYEPHLSNQESLGGASVEWAGWLAGGLGAERAVSSAAARFLGREAKSVGRSIGSASEGIYESTRPLADEFPELVGINPHYVEGGGPGVNTNCVSCTVAGHARLTGADPGAIAANGGLRDRNALLPMAGLGSKPATLSEITAQMLARGDGASNYVLIKTGPNSEHAINVFNRNGVVNFIDNQSGHVVVLKPGVELRIGGQL